MNDARINVEVTLIVGQAATCSVQTGTEPMQTAHFDLPNSTMLTSSAKSIYVLKKKTKSEEYKKI
jgi:hypothetical protein